MYDIQKKMNVWYTEMSVWNTEKTQEDYIHEKRFYFTLVETSEKGTR